MRVSVIGGSTVGAETREQARQAGRELAERGHELVCGVILIQRGNPALSVRQECSDEQSEPSAEQGGEEARTLPATTGMTRSWPNTKRKYLVV